ncbi:MAG TPA: ABC transporter permease [Anaeromyxobacteraceae bacterium]|nr:ABC transporter permease [Anaeromyxobacteraceae bacterium]
MFEKRADQKELPVKTAPGTDWTAPRSGRWRSLFAKPEVSVGMALIALCVVMTAASPYFLTVRNILNILRQFSLIAILAVGEGLIIITAGIDLSVGALVGMTACVGAWAAQAGAPPGLTLLVILGSGTLAGLVNGLLVTRVGIAPFIATLGMMSVARGISLLITLGSPIHYESTWISVLGGGHIGVVPVSVIVMLVIVAAGSVFATRTVLGKNVYAVGNSEKAAKLSGIRVGTTKTVVFTITGFLTGVCGLILVGQLEGADAFYGNGYELDVIAAAVIGGISLAGGEGNLLGIMVGAALMGVLKNAFVLLAVPGYWQTVAVGLVIIGAVSIDSLRKRK